MAGIYITEHLCRNADFSAEKSISGHCGNLAWIERKVQRERTFTNGWTQTRFNRTTFNSNVVGLCILECRHWMNYLVISAVCDVIAAIRRVRVCTAKQYAFTTEDVSSSDDSPSLPTWWCGCLRQLRWWRLRQLTWRVGAARFVSLWRPAICGTDTMHSRCAVLGAPWHAASHHPSVPISLSVCPRNRPKLTCAFTHSLAHALILQTLQCVHSPASPGLFDALTTE